MTNNRVEKRKKKEGGGKKKKKGKRGGKEKKKKTNYADRKCCPRILNLFRSHLRREKKKKKKGGGEKGGKGEGEGRPMKELLAYKFPLIPVLYFSSEGGGRREGERRSRGKIADEVYSVPDPNVTVLTLTISSFGKKRKKKKKGEKRKKEGEGDGMRPRGNRCSTPLHFIHSSACLRKGRGGGRVSVAVQLSQNARRVRFRDGFHPESGF